MKARDAKLKGLRLMTWQPVAAIIHSLSVLCLIVLIRLPASFTPAVVDRFGVEHSLIEIEITASTGILSAASHDYELKYNIKKRDRKHVFPVTLVYFSLFIR